MKGVDTMAFYRICPDCGAYLDPGEQCSCHEECLIEMERKEKATSSGSDCFLKGDIASVRSGRRC